MNPKATFTSPPSKDTTVNPPPLPPKRSSDNRAEIDQLRKENAILKQQVQYLETLVHDLKRAKRIIDSEAAKARGESLSPEGVRIVSGLEGFADHLDNGGTVEDWRSKITWPFRKGRGRGKGY